MATDAFYTGVYLRANPRALAHRVFGGLNYGAKLYASWLDSRDLLVTCQDCAKLGTGQLWAKDMECQWHGISIHYEFVGSSPVLHGVCP